MSLVLHGGHGKSLFVARDSIHIVQEHLAERRDKAILIRHISAIELKKPGAFDGYVEALSQNDHLETIAFLSSLGAQYDKLPMGLIDISAYAESKLLDEVRDLVGHSERAERHLRKTATIEQPVAR